MFSSAWLRAGLLLAAVASFAVAATPARGQEPRAYGQRLVAQYRLPTEAIARYAALAAGTSLVGAPDVKSLLADSEPWVGPEQRAGMGHNPYTLVFTVHGVTRTAGAVFAQWQAGWKVYESPVTSRAWLMAMPDIARTGLAAGEALSLTGSSSRVSFRGERSVAPMLSLVQASNLDINDVEVQVWSGAAPQAWASIPWPRAALVALGAACLLVGLGFTYWQRAQPAPVAPVASAQPLRSSAASALPRAKADAPTIESQRLGAAPAALSAQSRVLAALHQVLTLDPTVHNVPDTTRRRSRL